MELLQLRYFQQVAKSGNISRCAAELFISPPALSMSISRLEKELGVKLFERVGNRIELNKQGEVFLRHINNILAELDDAVYEVHNTPNEELYIATTVPNVWTSLFSSFSVNYPNITLSHRIVRLDNISTVDLYVKYDFLLASPMDRPREYLDYVQLYNDDYPVIVVSNKSHWADKKSAALADLKNEPFIAISKGLSSRKFFDNLCESAGFIPNISIECDYMVRYDLIRQNIGVGISTKRVWEQTEQPGLVALDIDTPRIPRSQNIYWDSRKTFSESALVFKNYAMEFFKKK